MRRRYRLLLTKHPNGVEIKRQYSFFKWWFTGTLWKGTVKVITNDQSIVKRWEIFAYNEGWGVIDKTQLNTLITKPR